MSYIKLNGKSYEQYKRHLIGGRLGDYTVYDKEGNTLQFGLPTKEDCKWMVDKRTASAEEMAALEKLYSLQIPELSRFVTKLTLAERELKKEEKYLLKVAVRIRDRKLKDKEF